MPRGWLADARVQITRELARAQPAQFRERFDECGLTRRRFVHSRVNFKAIARRDDGNFGNAKHVAQRGQNVRQMTRRHPTFTNWPGRNLVIQSDLDQFRWKQHQPAFARATKALAHSGVASACKCA